MSWSCDLARIRRIKSVMRRVWLGLSFAAASAKTFHIARWIHPAGGFAMV